MTDGKPTGAATGESGGQKFRLLFVCTANLCRSVMAEWHTRRLAELWLGDAAAVLDVRSAGTAASTGRTAHPYVLAELHGMGADAGGHRSRRLTAAMLDQADLVLTATVDQREAVFALSPVTLHRAFTVREFSRLARRLHQQCSPRFVAARQPGPGEEAVAARGVVAATARLRGLVPGVPAGHDDIPDPPARRAAFHDCAVRVSGAVNACFGALFLGDAAAIPTPDPPRRSRRSVRMVVGTAAGRTTAALSSLLAAGSPDRRERACPGRPGGRQ